MIGQHTQRDIDISDNKISIKKKDIMSTTNTNKPTGGESLPPCAICNAKIAIYRCPRCHTCTCSLECCRIHKKGGDSKEGSNNNKPCDGKRDRTQFCSLKGFTDSQLSSDYHFLEDVLKVSESTKRMYHGIVSGDSTNNTTSSTKRARTMAIKTGGRIDLDSISTKQQQSDHPLLQAKEGKSIISVLANGVADNDDDDANTEQSAKQPHNNPKNGIINELLGNNKPASKPPPSASNSNKKKEKIDPLIRQAELKGVNLLRMPPGMERRKSNTTKFNKKKGIITWKVELCFHLPKDTSDISEGVSTNEDKKKTLPRFLKVETNVQDSSTLSEELGKHLDVHSGNSATRSQLRQFTTVPRESLLIFIKRLPCRSSSPQYYKLDPNMTLMELLKGKTIIEFPTIDVIIASDDVGSSFPLFIGEVG